MTQQRQRQPQRQTQRRQATSASASTRSRRTSANSSRYAEPQAPTWRRITIGKVVALIALVIAVVFAVRFCSAASSITVTINGSPYELRGDKTMAVALKESGLPVNPGDLISLSGNILERNAGDPFFATVGDEETADPEYKLHDGDTITLTDGKDTVEPYDAVESPVPCGVSIVGLGPIHTFSLGEEGVMETRTGKISGEVVEKQTVDPKDLTETRSTPDIGSRKIIALTFDEGPSDAYTGEILDILKKNNAQATFFFLGESIDLYGPDLVKRAADEGHQVCTHSYDDALVTKGVMSNLSSEQQIDQIDHGCQVIADAIGYQPSRLIRVGNQELEDSSIVVLAPHIEAEIGWTLDTGDWLNTGEEQIYDVLMSAQPGDVVRMHDGGGLQDATVSALERALPKLVKKGYEFVTINEYMSREVPPEEQPAQ